MERLLTSGLIALSLLLFSGCSGGSDFSDINAFMDEVDGRGKSRIEPLPTIVTVAPFAYKAADQRSPFEPPVLALKPIERPKDGQKIRPNSNRVKQFLEQFPIGQLAMVGTLAQRADFYALVQDGAGGVHRVQQGDYMGTDHGRIRRIDDGAIQLIEIVPDGTGNWVQRERMVSLGGGE